MLKAVFIITSIIQDSNQSSQNKIRAAIKNHINPENANPNYFYSFVHELKYLPKYRRLRLNKIIIEYNTLFKEILDEGILNNTFSKTLDSHLAMLQLISLCNNAPIWVNKKIGCDLHQIAESISDIFLSGIIGRRH